MNTNTLAASEPSVPTTRQLPAIPADALILALVTVVCNVPLVTGSTPGGLLFTPADVSRGEWWRVVIHPFVHVSWYHLALDAGGFFMLYLTLSALSPVQRLLLTGGALAGSIGGALCADASVAALGLCGLSGTAHGLMAACGLEQVRNGTGRAERVMGAVALLTVSAKSICEAVTGRLFLDILHFGDIGVPMVTCHAGGFAGGAMAWVLMAAVCRLRTAAAR